MSTGKCSFCGATFGKAVMSKHLASCKQRNVSPVTSAGKPSLQKTRTFHLVAQGRHSPEYWIHLAAPSNTMLTDLDGFLRDIWLECCGHLSLFTIEGVAYSSSPMKEYRERGMKVALGDILNPGMKFHYEYDFGSTTELVVRVISEMESEFNGKSVQLMARNEPPLMVCGSCKEIATRVCTECYAWLCGRCVSGHKCGKDMLLPVVNSPRVGVCGYSG